MKVLHFVTWGSSDVPAYTKYYIDQLAPWHDKVFVTTNEDRPVDTSWFEKRGYELTFAPNKSRDYEKHHHFMMRQGRDLITSYSRLTFVNDCVICFGPLDKLMKWVESRGEELLGLNSSKFPLAHIMGYFVVMQKPMLGRAWDHFEKTGVVTPQQEISEYELRLPLLAESMAPMYPQGMRRGWDEFFWTPFDDGVPLVKHSCIMPRRVFLLQQWQKRVTKMAHPDTKAWQYLPLLADPKHTFRNVE